MGWTTRPKTRGSKIVDELRREFNSEFAEIIDYSIHNRTTAYLAVRIKSTGIVVAYVVLTHITNYKRWGYSTISYKDIEETCGPYYFDCPKRILDKLSEPFNKTAERWRDICRGTAVSYDN